jgi:hypothetical protein
MHDKLLGGILGPRHHLVTRERLLAGLLIHEEVTMLGQPSPKLTQP